jgi:hypothetical protein
VNGSYVVRDAPSMDWEAKRCFEEGRCGRDCGPRNANIRGSDGVDQKLGGRGRYFTHRDASGLCFDE